MSKRLQVVLDDAELQEIQAFARDRHVTVAEWVRQVLRAARADQASDPRRKLSAVRSAAVHSFPVGDIDEMLAEIEAGYAGGRPGRSR